jgi:hypothetical protein
MDKYLKYKKKYSQLINVGGDGTMEESGWSLLCLSTDPESNTLFVYDIWIRRENENIQYRFKNFVYTCSHINANHSKFKFMMCPNSVTNLMDTFEFQSPDNNFKYPVTEAEVKGKIMLVVDLDTFTDENVAEYGTKDAQQTQAAYALLKLSSGADPN